MCYYWDWDFILLLWTSEENFSEHILLDNNLVNWNVEIFTHISISPFYNFSFGTMPFKDRYSKNSHIT